MPISFRFPIALVLLIVCLAASAWAGIDAGNEAYERGDYATAMREWRPLAERGDALAQQMLGSLFYYGYGVPQDHVQARQWFEQSAAQGYARAQFNLGVLYAQGEGLPQDFIRAYMWLNVAAEASRGDDVKTAIKNQNSVASQLTAAQIVRLEEWQEHGRGSIRTKEGSQSADGMSHLALEGNVVRWSKEHEFAVKHIVDQAARFRSALALREEHILE